MTSAYRQLLRLYAAHRPDGPSCRSGHGGRRRELRLATRVLRAARRPRAGDGHARGLGIRRHHAGPRAGGLANMFRHAQRAAFRVCGAVPDLRQGLRSIDETRRPAAAGVGPIHSAGQPERHGADGRQPEFLSHRGRCRVGALGLAGGDDRAAFRRTRDSRTGPARGLPGRS